MTRGSDSDPVELGVKLLANLCDGDTELSLSDAMDRIETITTHPATTRAILDTAETRGIIERDDGTVALTGAHTTPQFESAITTMEGSFTCRKCGQSLSTGYFMKLGDAELGPFGPVCVRKVAGTE